MILTLTTVAVVASVLTWALHREFARLEQERQLRALHRWMTNAPEFERMQRAFQDLADQVARQLLPALQKAAADLRAILPAATPRDTEGGGERG